MTEGPFILGTDGSQEGGGVQDVPNCGKTEIYQLLWKNLKIMHCHKELSRLVLSTLNASLLDL